MFPWSETIPFSQFVAETVWWVCALVFMAIRLRPMLRARRQAVARSAVPPGDVILRRLGEIAGGVLPLAYIVFKVPGFANYPWFPPNAVIGALVFAAAIWLIDRSHRDLGRSFSTTLEMREQHELVTNGIYRYIRHPIYAAFLLWTIAQAILLPNWVVGLFAPLVALTVFVIRVPREEQMMIDTFGDGYRAYMQRTARFVPGVY